MSAGGPRRETAERGTQGLCARCGKAPAAPDRTACEPCLEKRRADDRARYARGKAAGLPYGGANVEAKRRGGRAKSKRHQKARREAGLHPLRPAPARRRRHDLRAVPPTAPGSGAAAI